MESVDAPAPYRVGQWLPSDYHGQKPGLHATNIQVNARIATVVR
jgi:hypothetical protein